MALFWTGVNIPIDQNAHWDFIFQQLLPKLTQTTFLLVCGTIAGTILLASSLSMFIQFIPKRFQTVFEVLLTLPIVFPIYIYAYIYIGMFEWASPISTLLRDLNLFIFFNIDYINLKNIFGAILIFSFALYPYIFIPLNLSFKNNWTSFYHTARLLKRSHIGLTLDFLRSHGKKPIIIGTLVVAMECLSEFGAVAMIGIDTFTTAIYTAITSFHSIEMAARIGLFLMGLALMLIAIESTVKRETIDDQLRSKLPSPKVNGFTITIIFIFLILICLMVLGIPLVQLLFWSLQAHYSEHWVSILELSSKSAFLGFCGSFILITLSLFLIFSARISHHNLLNWLKRFILPFILIGYSIPGNLIAVALLILAGLFFTDGMSYQSGFIFLIFGLCFKFIRASYKQMELGNSFISKNLEFTSLVLNKNQILRFFKEIHLPLMKPYILYSFLLVTIEIIKEMPLTLILRPMGFNTLATKIFELTSEGEWEITALYTLPVVILCLLVHFSMTFLNSWSKSKS